MKGFFAILLILSFVFSSCGLAKNSDEENINDLILELRDVLMSTYETGEENEDVKSSITPLFWYRDVSQSDSIDYKIRIDVEGDSAHALITGIFPGVLNLYYVNDSLDTALCQKNFVDTLTRSVVFSRDTLKEYHGGWRVAKITGAEISTENPPAMSIDSVKLFKEGVIDTVITGIDLYFPRNEIISLPSGESIEVTLYSPDTTGFFYIHSAFRRSKLSRGETFYFGTYRVPLIAGTYRVAFDGISEYSLLETDSVYSAYGWMLPYKSE
ncbi:MAG: hypothetical protein PHW02_08415 [bacterium]|nr:hypothetical protein [bacterium]